MRNWVFPMSLPGRNNAHGMDTTRAKTAISSWAIGATAIDALFIALRFGFFQDDMIARG